MNQPPALLKAQRLFASYSIINICTISRYAAQSTIPALWVRLMSLYTFTALPNPCSQTSQPGLPHLHGGVAPRGLRVVLLALDDVGPAAGDAPRRAALLACAHVLHEDVVPRPALQAHHLVLLTRSRLRGHRRRSGERTLQHPRLVTFALDEVHQLGNAVASLVRAARGGSGTGRKGDKRARGQS